MQIQRLFYSEKNESFFEPCLQKIFHSAQGFFRKRPSPSSPVFTGTFWIEILLLPRHLCSLLLPVGVPRLRVFHGASWVFTKLRFSQNFVTSWLIYQLHNNNKCPFPELCRPGIKLYCFLWRISQLTTLHGESDKAAGI